MRGQTIKALRKLWPEAEVKRVVKVWNHLSADQKQKLLASKVMFNKTAAMINRG